MSTPIYSKVVVAGTNDGSAVQSYELALPAQVFVIRTMDHFMQPDPVGSAFSIADDAGAVIFSVTYGPHAGEWEHWEGRQVFNPGDHLNWNVTLGPLDEPATLRVSGYLLAS